MGVVPRVSVVVASYNCRAFVLDCLASVAAQTHRDLEVIVCDDASTDGSAELVEGWLARLGSPSSWRILRSAENGGICRNVNRGLALATGEYVAVLGADDEWMPDHLARHVEVMERLGEDVAAVYCDAQVIDPCGRPLADSFLATRRPLAAPPPEGDLFLPLLEGNFLPAPAVLMRRRCLDEAGRYDERLAYEDWDMWLRLARRHRFVYRDGATVRYRRVPGSLTDVLGGRTLESDFRVLMRCRGHSRRANRVVAERVSTIARRLYAEGRPGHRRRLLATLAVDRRPGTWATALLAAVGVPHATVARLRRALGRYDGRDARRTPREVVGAVVRRGQRLLTPAWRAAMVVRSRDVTSEVASRSCVVLAPHPDDETLGCGAIVARKAAAGTEVVVVVVGDGGSSHPPTAVDRTELVATRAAEVVEACRVLGVPPDRVVRLAVPDEGLAARHEEVVFRVAALVATHEPDDLYVTSAWDWHPDHQALNRIARDVVAGLARPPRLLEYSVWWWAEGPWARHRGRTLRRALRDLVVEPLAPLREVPAERVRVGAHRSVKRRAIAAHRSQVARRGDDPTWAVLDRSTLRALTGRWELLLPATATDPDRVGRALRGARAPDARAPRSR